MNTPFDLAEKIPTGSGVTLDDLLRAARHT